MAIVYARVPGQIEITLESVDPASGTFDNAPAEGNLIVVHAMERSGGSAANFTISGTGWTKQVVETTLPGDANARRTHVVWWKVAGPSEPATITVDDGTSSGKRMMMEEYTAGASVTWTFEDVVVANTGTGTGSPLASGSTTSISGEQLLIGSTIWRTGSSAQSSVAFSGLSGLGGAVGGSNGFTVMSAWDQDATTGTKSTTVSFTGGTDAEGNVALLVFSATEAGGDQELDVPFFQQTNSIFPLTVQNQSPLELEIPFHGSEAQLFAPAVVNQSSLELNVPHLASSAQLFAPTLTSGDKQLDIPFFQSTNSFFAPSVANQSPQNINPGFIASAEQLFAPSLLSQSNENLDVPFFQNVALLFTPTVFNEGEELFEPTLVGNGTLADRIMAGLIDQGFLTGTIVDREYARLLAKLSLTAPQPKSLDDLYSMADEDNRILNIGVDELTPA